MSRSIIKKTQAKRDLVEHFVFIGQDNLEAAHRFLAAADGTFQQLAETPGLGRLREVSNPDLKGLRSWRIRGFENWLVFYRPIEDGIEVIRVLHGARDIEGVLEEDRGG